jgi:hypothetical protein
MANALASPHIFEIAFDAPRRHIEAPITSGSSFRQTPRSCGRAGGYRPARSSVPSTDTLRTDPKPWIMVSLDST